MQQEQCYMLWLKNWSVVEELVPDYSQGKHSNLGTIGFALGFALMMVLDVVLG